MSTSSSAPSGASPSYALHYWPGLPGRGEFARLLFAETGTAYSEPFAQLEWPEIRRQLDEMKTAHQHFHALPCLSVTLPSAAQPLLISQSAVMCRYLAVHLDGGRLQPKSEAGDYRCQELAATVVDAVGDGHDAWHAIDHNGSYASQREATQPFIDTFLSKRLPRWLSTFESTLKQNGGQVFVGSELSWVDLFIFQWLHGVESQCPQQYAELPIPTLRAFKQRIESRPGIAERVKARRQYDGTGPCF